MKVIDLLNKIANNEEVPKKIKWEDTIFAYSDYDKDYLEFPFSEEEYKGLFCMKDSILTQYLNDEIEIIEEKPKKIEEVPAIELLGQCDNWLQHSGTEEKSCMELNPYILETITRNFRLLYHKQCELTKAINYLLEKESDK